MTHRLAGLDISWLLF